MPVLADIYSRSDAFKRKLIDALRNPGDTLRNMRDGAVDDIKNARQMIDAATDEGLRYGPATERLAMKMAESYNPIGMTVNYPRAEALEVARQNAVKTLGLPPNNTAMDRAKAMGFEDVYHGTGRDFLAFERGHTSTHTTGAAPSTMDWVSKEPHIADGYAMSHYFGGNPTVMPLMVRSEGKVAKDMKYKRPSDLPMSSTDRFAGNLFKRNKSADVVEMQNFIDPAIPGYPGLGTHIAVKNPEQLRSRFAAFDPARLNENDLLAGMLPLGALALPKEDEKKKKDASAQDLIKALREPGR